MQLHCPGNPHVWCWFHDDALTAAQALWVVHSTLFTTCSTPTPTSHANGHRSQRCAGPRTMLCRQAPHRRRQ
jgi:hypothetical protein